MKPIRLGGCCRDCFNALNFNSSQLPPDDIKAATRAARELSALAERERVVTLHTEEGYPHYSALPCMGCGSALAGDRWELVGLQERKDN